MADLINSVPLGEDSEKGGVFFDSNLIPGGTFSNIPKYYSYAKPDINTDGALVLTLEKIKDSIKEQLKEEDGAEADDVYIEKFLYEFVSLLIDYRDMRNYIFYGSANTEIAYNIKKIIETYPYKFWVSTLTADLNTPSALIEIVNRIQDNETDLIFKEGAIRDGIEQFNFFDNITDFDWSKYEILDKNSNVYKIKKVTSPYIDEVSVLAVTAIGMGTNPTQTDNRFSTPIVIPAFDTMQITTNTNHTYQVGQVVNLMNTSVSNGTIDLDISGEYCVVNVVDATNFLVVNKYRVQDLQGGGFAYPYDAITIDTGYSIISGTDSLVRLYPSNFNQRPYTIKFTIKGNLFENYLISDEISETSGIIISPNKTTLSEYDYNLSPIQRMLLAPDPINPTPWPRRSVTNNIQNLLSDSPFNSEEPQFILWLQGNEFLYLKKDNEDVDMAFSDVYQEYRLTRALSLDETETNQLVRRCIPQDMISELNDTPDSDFQRFVLIAGWFFDQIRLYVKFLKYVHHIDASDFNQLSPEYYRLFASHYGLDLFTDDGIDFSKLVIKTEPGLYFRDKVLDDKNSKYYRFTIQQLQYERQKRLLLSLFFLYRAKGTQDVLKKLVSLLGAPEGFFILSEYAFKIDDVDAYDYYDTNNMLGRRVVNNNKIHIPEFVFEIDPDYPTVGTDMPPVYRTRLNNESTFNLRQLGVQTNPNGAIDNQIINVFGKQKAHYGKFEEGQFANLQNDEGEYYALPLTIPDKFFGVSVEYMIPRTGFQKGIGNNLDEVNIHLCSLYQVPVPASTTKLAKYFSYPLPENFSNFDYASWKDTPTDNVIESDNEPNVRTDFNFLQRYQPNTGYNSRYPYIITRLEGKDLVVRLKVRKEVNNASSENDERVAIVPNVFEADGLNHTIRLIYRPEGVEVYKDYKHLGVMNEERIGIGLWRDPQDSSLPNYFSSFEIPKKLIYECAPAILTPGVFTDETTNTGDDAPMFWDMFVGLPSNIDFYFKRVSVFENYAIDSFDTADNLNNDKNYTSEYWSFNFSDNEGDVNDFKIRCEFSEIEPNMNNADYSYILPVEQFNSKIVIEDLKLYSKSTIPGINGQKYFYRTQDFFNVDKIFEENVWDRRIHNNYVYDNFSQKLINLYSIYSSQVLTYDSLAPFLDLIENKFKPLIKDFIPIVINISEFGRLIQNSLFNQPKARYINIHKKCIGRYDGKTAILQFRLYDYIEANQDFSFEFDNGNGTSLIPPIPIAWNNTEDLTLFDVLFAMRDPLVNVNNLKILTYLYDGLMAITIDTDWYYTTYGQNPNDIQFIVRQGSNVLVFQFEHASLDFSDNECGSIEYRLPSRKTKEVWIYFASEHQPPRYIYNASEGSTNNTFIKDA